MNRWFVSDWHLGHENIIKYANRPFKDAKEMDDCLLTYHNELVKSSDHYSNLGDVTMLRGGRVQREAFCKQVKRFNGHARLFLGNHDHFPIQTYVDAGFEKIYATWRDESGILFSHYPIHSSSLGSAIANVHGHIHQNKSPEPVMTIDKKTQRVRYQPYVNISVEAIGYKPVNYDTLLQMIRTAVGQWEGVKV